MKKSTKEIILIFFSSIILKSLFLILWHSWKGKFSINFSEVYFYFGVMKGNLLPTGGMYDVTVHLLRFIGLFWESIYAVEFASIVLVSISAVLIYLISEHVYSNGLIPGLLYVFLTGVNTSVISGFTHDHIQIPLILCVILLALKKKWVFSGLLLIISLGVSYSDIVGVGVLGVIYSIRKGVRTSESLLLLTLIVVFGCNVWLDGVLAGLPQAIAGGSMDITPTSLTNLTVRYNILLLILPLAILSSYRRDDGLGLSFLLIGGILMLYMDRGSRIFDLGIAFTVGSYLRGKLGYILILVAILTIAININYVNEKTTHIDEAYLHIAESMENKTGSLLIAWDKGYMFKSLTKMEPTSSAGWMQTEKHCKLSGIEPLDVDYLIMSEDDYEVVNESGELKQRYNKALLLDKCQDLDCNIFKIRYYHGVGDFRLIKQVGKIRVYGHI